MKKILIIAGPNGAGKTTFAGEFLQHEAACPEFVNADLIASGLSPFQPETVAIAAGRLMLERIADLAKAGNSFALETTLSTRTYLRLIPQWQAEGYVVKLYFLMLPDPEFAIQRVARRVRHGGHNIPPETIVRRFERGLGNFRNAYIGIVDEWAIYDASHSPPLLLETGRSNKPQSLMEDPTTYQTPSPQRVILHPSEDPDFIGAEAALKRASEKAIAKDIAAGLEPIVSNRSWIRVPGMQ